MSQVLFSMLQDESNEEIPLKKQKTEQESSICDRKIKQKVDDKSTSGGEEKSQIKDIEKTEDESEKKPGEKEGVESKSSSIEEKCETETKEKEKEEVECKSKTRDNEKDDIEENLQCMICQEIMHDCIR